MLKIYPIGVYLLSCVETILASKRYHTLSAFNTVYGIGPEIARNLYETKGIQTMDQLRRYYDVEEGCLSVESSQEASIDPPDLTIVQALSYVDDLSKKYKF